MKTIRDCFGNEVRLTDERLGHILQHCVVVKYLVRGAFVITAYLTDKPKAGETVWPRK